MAMDVAVMDTIAFMAVVHWHYKAVLILKSLKELTGNPSVFDHSR
jgi:hypothetical protein